MVCYLVCLEQDQVRPRKDTLCQHLASSLPLFAVRSTVTDEETCNESFSCSVIRIVGRGRQSVAWTYIVSSCLHWPYPSPIVVRFESYMKNITESETDGKYKGTGKIRKSLKEL
jgi:hypothetical protein